MVPPQVQEVTTLPLIVGVRTIVLVSMAESPKPWAVTVISPVPDVATLATYLDVDEADSQPHPPAPGNEPAAVCARGVRSCLLPLPPALSVEAGRLESRLAKGTVQAGLWRCGVELRQKARPDPHAALMPRAPPATRTARGSSGSAAARPAERRPRAASTGSREGSTGQRPDLGARSPPAAAGSAPPQDKEEEAAEAASSRRGTGV